MQETARGGFLQEPEPARLCYTRGTEASRALPGCASAEGPIKGGNDSKVEFYNVKTKSKIDVPESNITKKKMVRKTKSGATQTRYALIGQHDGMTLYKFVNQATYEGMNVKEVK
ncbi:MAG: hypothetical protein C4341_03355 [Armatimonadota bacterium]